LLINTRGHGDETRIKMVARTALSLFLILVFWGVSAHAEDFWSYSGEITHKGTRSEGFIGRLYYQGKAVPPKVSQIVTSIGEFKYKSSISTSWARMGWIKVSKFSNASLVQILSAHDSKENALHWLFGESLKKPPRIWVRLPLYNYWVDPEYLQQFSDMALKTILEPDRSPVTGLTEGMEDPAKTTSTTAIFVYKESIANKGSKSAGFRGVLLHNDKPLMEVGTLKTPIGTFNAVSFDKLWEAQGWLPADDIATKDTAAPVSEADLKKGNYTGARKAGTPSDWCYSPVLDMWFLPE